MLVPTALSFPCTLHSPHGDGIAEGVDPTAAFANDVMTIPISMGGFPSVSVPVRGENLNDGSVDNSPCSKNNVGTDSENNQIGIQIFASRGSEELVLRVCKCFAFFRSSLNASPKVTIKFCCRVN